MKVILYANVSMNGMVLLSENSNHQVPPEVISLAMNEIAEARNLIMGRKSFDVFEDVMGGSAGIQKAMPGVELVCFSKSVSEKSGYTIAATPEEALRNLNKKGYDKVILGGGTETYNAFLESDAVDEVLFNVIPIITNGGVLNAQELNPRFKLIEHKMIANDVIRLRWTRN